MGRGLIMAYETFAFVYDEVMDSSLYQKWLDFSCRHLGEKTNYGTSLRNRCISSRIRKSGF